MNTIWLTGKEVDSLAATIGSLSDATYANWNAILERINDEVGVSAVRAQSNESRRALASVSGKSHALLLTDDEIQSLAMLPLGDSLKRKFGYGF